MNKRCEICEIELDERDFLSHVLGKKHLKKKETAEFRERLLANSIFVTNLPSGLTLDRAVNFFKQFGVVKHCKLERNFAIVEFVEREPVKFLLNKPIWMGRHRLNIGRRRLADQQTSGQDKETAQDKEKSIAEIVFAELKRKLESQKTFDGELAAFLETVQLDEEVVERNWQSLRVSLLETLRSRFPKGEINRFGSSVTGLGFKESDIDVYLDIGEPISDDDEETQQWTPRTLFREVKLLLYKKKKVFDRIVLIPRAKTPLIKFCHTPTNTNCDLSFKNGLGVINSELIKQLLNADPRLKPLMIIIKYWGKTFELSGCGKFTNYAVVMMLIFYLQQPEVNLLPAIAELQKNCEPAYHRNWQVNFDRSAIAPPSQNNSSIIELLQGFFKFWVNFSFDKKLICPLDGLAHARTDYAKIGAEKGEDQNCLSLDRPVCLQDPIELDNNITACVTSKALEKFQSFCQVGDEVCGVALKTENKSLLLNLFMTLPAPLEKKSCSNVTILVGKTLLAGLPRDFESRTDIEDKKVFQENNWYTLVQRLAEDTLKRVFKLEVQPMKNDRDAKHQKIEATSDVHSKNNDQIVLECTGTHCVISKRRLIASSFCIDPTVGPIDKEALISNELISKQEANGVKPTKLDFTCTVLRERNPLRLVLRMKDRASAKKRFQPFVAFARTKIPSIIEKELIRMLQYNTR